MEFDNSMAAKQFLVSRIVQEAVSRRVRLSDAERDMLYFSESYPTLPNMAEIAEEFENKYDDEKYEKKISKLARSAHQRDSKESPDLARLWKEAIEVLNKEDHYILVMLNVPHSFTGALKSIGRGLVIICAGLGTLAALVWFGQHLLPRIPDSIQVFSLVTFLAALFVLGSNKNAGTIINRWSDRLEKWVTGAKPLR